MTSHSYKLCAAGLLLAVSTASVQAFEIFGLKFFEDDTPDTVEMISPLFYNLEWSVAGDDVDLSNTIRGSSTLIRDMDQPASGRAGLLSSANGDYGRLVETLYARGYYAGTVSILLDGKEAADLPLDVDLPNPVSVEISIDPGPVYTFRTAQIENVLPGTDLSDFGFEPGLTAKSDAVRDAGRAAVKAWAKEGYAKADIPNAQVEADHRSRQLDATLEIVEGPQVTYGPVSVTGTNRVRHDYLEFMTDLPTGRTYDPDEVERARTRLLKLDAFGVVDIEEQPIGPDNSMPIAVTVQDRKPRRFGLGATISTLDGAGVEGFWLHRNILSRAERLRFDGAVRGIGRSLDPSEYDYELGATFIKPGTLTPDTDFRLNVTLEREQLDNFDALTFGLSAGMSWVVNERLVGSSDFVLERSRIDDSLGRRNFMLYGIDTRVTYERRDIPLDATRGYFLDVSAFPFYETTSGKVGIRATAEARAYRQLGSTDKFILAGRGKIGSVAGLSLTEAPPQVLFFSGGGGSVRGFEYQANGVRLPTGQEVGGRSLIEASAELRTKLSENFGVVGFLDAAIVGPEAMPDFTAEIDVGIGLGVRWQTGLGPLRIDVARAVNRKQGDPVVGVYIGLGQAF